MPEEKRIDASYCLLRSGEWGVRIKQGEVKPGDRVTVTKKSGDTKRETIKRVVWTNKIVSLCEIDRAPKEQGKRYECQECGEMHSQGDGTECWETGLKH